MDGGLKSVVKEPVSKDKHYKYLTQPTNLILNALTIGGLGATALGILGAVIGVIGEIPTGVANGDGATEAVVIATPEGGGGLFGRGVELASGCLLSVGG